ncbi:MAG: sensor histidine kinase, partial [Phocaeicola sp.]
MKKGSKLMVFLILAAWLMAAGCTSFGNKNQRKVLIVNSYGRRSSLYLEFHKTQLQALENAGIKAEIRYIYLDCQKYNEQEEIERMRVLVDSATSSWKPEVILVNDDQATHSLLKAEIPMLRTV